MKFDQKNVLLRSIAWIISLEKPCYLENRAVREPCKLRSACIPSYAEVFVVSKCPLLHGNIQKETDRDSITFLV